MASAMHRPGCYWLLVHGDRRFPPGLHEVPRPRKRHSRTGVLMAIENIVEWRHKVDAHTVWLSVPGCRSQRGRGEHGEAAGRAARRIGRRGHPGAGMLVKVLFAM